MGTVAYAPLTPSASAAALGHKNMQAYFCDARFARYWGMGKCNKKAQSLAKQGDPKAKRAQSTSVRPHTYKLTFTFSRIAMT